jgi:replicative DNA helicase
VSIHALDMTRREPPVNYEAEQAVLAAILRDAAAFDLVGSFLLAEHFAEEVHGRIYRACKREIEAGRRPTVMTLKMAFEKDGALKDVGGAEYLRDLEENAISIQVTEVGRVIFEAWQRRRLIEWAEWGLRAAHEDHDDDMAALLAEAERGLSEISDGSALDGPGVEPLSDAAGRALEALEEARKAKAEGRAVGLSTGLLDLDAALTGGLRPGQLIVLGGRPSMGKSALAFNIAEAAARAGAATAVFSIEMSGEELATRHIAAAAGQDLTRAIEGDLTDDEFDRLIEVTRATAGLPLFLDESQAATVGAIRSKARRIKRKYGLDLLVVDYLQLLEAEGRHENRVQDITTMTRALKRLARNLNCCVLLLSQLNREVERREDRRPRLSDLRESGSIEQDADKILLIYRDEYYARLERPAESEQAAYNAWLHRMNKIRGVAEINVAKQRHGRGNVKIYAHFDEKITRFSNLAQRGLI